MAALHVIVDNPTADVIVAMEALAMAAVGDHTTLIFSGVSGRFTVLLCTNE